LCELNLILDDGFRLTYLGYDFLAIKTMVNKGVFVAVGRQIGVGKESGILVNALLISCSSFNHISYVFFFFLITLPFVLC